MNAALQQALQQVLAELQKADGARLKGGMGATSEAPGEPGPEGMEEPPCPECEAGTCSNPDHMDDSALAGMMEG